ALAALGNMNAVPSSRTIASFLAKEYPWNVSEAAAVALGKMGTRAVEYSSAVMQRLKEFSPGALYAARELLNTLEAMHATAESPSIVDLMKTSTDGFFQLECARVLLHLDGFTVEEATRTVSAVLYSSDEYEFYPYKFEALFAELLEKGGIGLIEDLLHL